MARLLPLLLLLLAGFVIYVVLRQGARPRSERVFRPHASPFGRRPQQADAGTHWVVSRDELVGLRDGYSSAAIDPAKPLFRCGGCQAYYHEDSVLALRMQNGGRCALCGSGDLRDVHVV